MAVITLSGLVSDINGSIAGSTFQRSSAGLTVRVKPRPVGKGTNSQLNQRNIVSNLNYYWTNLTIAQRQAWSSFAVYTNGVNKTNNQKSSSNNGKTQFFAVNSWLLLYGKSIVSTPVFGIPELINPPYVVNGNQSDNLGKTVNSIDITKEVLIFQISLPQSVSTNTANTGFRTLVFTQIDGNTQDITTAYLSKFGINLVKGNRYWIQTRVVNFINGTISPSAKALILYTDITSSGIGSMVIGSTFIVS